MHTPGLPLVRLNAVAARAAHFSSRSVIILIPARIADTVNGTCPPTVIPKTWSTPQASRVRANASPPDILGMSCLLQRPFTSPLGGASHKAQFYDSARVLPPPMPPPFAKDSELMYYIFYALTPKRPPPRSHPNGPHRKRDHSVQAATGTTVRPMRPLSDTKKRVADTTLVSLQIGRSPTHGNIPSCPARDRSLSRSPAAFFLSLGSRSDGPKLRHTAASWPNTAARHPPRVSHTNTLVLARADAAPNYGLATLHGDQTMAPQWPPTSTYAATHSKARVA